MRLFVFFFLSINERVGRTSGKMYPPNIFRVNNTILVQQKCFVEQHNILIFYDPLRIYSLLTVSQI